MDIHCKHCGEPWDHDELHEVYDADDNKVSYTKAGQLFAEYGCGAFTFNGPKKCTNAMVDPERAERAGMMQEITEYPEEWALFD